MQHYHFMEHGALKVLGRPHCIDATTLFLYMMTCFWVLDPWCVGWSGCQVLLIMLPNSYRLWCVHNPLWSIIIYTVVRKCEPSTLLLFYVDFRSLYGNLTGSCNLDCGCSRERYNPVCGADKTLYFSPCHAGCVSVGASQPAAGKVNK